MSISLHSLKKGMFVEIGGDPYQVMEAQFLRMQQRKPVVQTKVKSLLSGKTIEKSFKPSDKIDEAEITKSPAEFFYQTKDEIFFNENDQKVSLSKEELGNKTKFLTKGTSVSLIKFNDDVISVELPPKVDLKIKFSPDGSRGDTSQGKVTKDAETETGLHVRVPLFVKEGDVIRVSTESGEYVERVN